jgi:uncharacterized protein (TIGR02466 family)
VSFQAKSNTTVRDLFASPIVVSEWPESARLNADLRAAIMARFETSPGVVSSNRKSWHSKRDMHRWPEPCVAELMAMVKSAAAAYGVHCGGTLSTPDDWEISTCWSNVNPPGGYNQAHNHVGEKLLLSGFYYVDLGDCSDANYAGRTIFQDRSGVARPIAASGGDPLSREYAVVPRPGVMLLFPATQFHYVEPYRGNSVRISIAFNLTNRNFEALYYPDMLEESWWWRNFRGLMLLKTKVPEKLRAFVRFGSYLIKELGQQRPGVSLLQRIKVTRDRAEADEAEAREAASGAPRLGEKLPEKKPLI